MRGVTVVEQHAKSVINAVKGMPFAWSINPYRGCYHRCVFCYARRTHTFLERDGVSEWGSTIYVKVNAERVARSEVSKRSWKHEGIAIGTVTDPYQPLEGRYRLTRGILGALADYDTPAHVITRSPLIVRDIDMLQRLARGPGAGVAISIATLDRELAAEIEPTVAPPHQRLRAVAMLAQAGIKVSVALAPLLPGINDSAESIDRVVKAAHEAGAVRVWHNTLYLHDVTRDAFFAYLTDKRPDLLARYATLYRGAYAPRAISDAIDARLRDARSRHATASTLPRITARANAQLSLL